MPGFQNTANIYESYDTTIGFQAIPDPGSNGTFALTGRWGQYCTVASGTRKLADNLPPFITFYVYATGNVTLTNAAGTTVATLAAGELAVCMPTGATAWVSTVLTVGALEINTASDLPVSGLTAYTGDTDVNAVLQGILETLISTNGMTWVGVPLGSFREVSSGGDPGNNAALGGVLTAETTPSYIGDANEALCIQWASSNSDIIAASVALPPNFNPGGGAAINLLVQSAGSSNAPSFSVLTNWDGGTQVSDSATGTANALKQTLSVAVAAADIAAGAQFLSLQIVPGAHTTDAFSLYGVQVRCIGNEINASV